MNQDTALGDRAKNAQRSRGLADALQSLSIALQQTGVEALGQESVRRAVRAVCAVARREHMRPEQLIIELKRMIAECMLLGRIARDKHDVIGAGLIQYAIESYFKNLE
jgi:hypothetical protein